MQKQLVTLLCLGILFAALPARAALNSDSFIRAGTPEAARVISRLERARRIDQMDAQGYMGAANRDAGIFYYQKSQEIDALLKRFRQGEAVSMDDVLSALNNADAVRYGGSF